MALDGAFLHHLRREIEENAVGAKVDKIYQPNKEEIVLLLRSRTGNYKLLVSARANSARIHFTKFAPENPKQPPMLCMLLRKRLIGAKLAAVRQPELERMLILDFDTVSELGDKIRLSLVAEIMGRYSNIILLDENGKIIDALKRVSPEMSSERLVLPGLDYRMPPPQDKLCPLSVGRMAIIDRIKSIPGDMELSKALLLAMQGVSPIVCRELQYLTGRGTELHIHEMTDEQFQRLAFFLGRLAETVKNTDGEPYILVAAAGKKPIDFSFLNIQQYSIGAVVSRKENFSELLDAFYEERDRVDRMRVRSQDLLRVLTTASDRLSRKINIQRAELEHCAQRDTLRRYGDLINANLYKLEKGQSSAVLQDFYDETLPDVKIKLNPMLTPARNAQKYYKEYRKAKTAEEMLNVQIDKARHELSYLDTVFEELSRAADENDLLEIRAELMEQGYIRMPKGSKKQASAQKPMEFTSDDGFTILVGRNNRQNDVLTLKQAKKDDLWFHTKNIPGSHVILVTAGQKATPAAIRKAAALAAGYSRGVSSSKVPVDYTLVRNVSKPQGAKPGMVIYVANKTVFVSPENC